MDDPVLTLASEMYRKGVEAELAGDIEAAKYYYAQAAIKFYQSASYAKGVAHEVRIKKAEECKNRIQNLSRAIPKSSHTSQIYEEEEDRSYVLDMEKPTITFKDVIGLEDVKERLKIAMVYPRKYKSLYEKFKLKKGGRIIMYGPPGCGKTLIAKACAGELGLTLVNGNVAKLMSKWVGEAEKNISYLFSEVRKMGEVVVFLDELDAIGASREKVSSSTVARRVVTQLLLEMNNLPEGILLIAATNTPWVLDPALIRTGRLGTPVFVPPPDREARVYLFKKCLEGRPVDDSVDVEKLADLTSGYSASDITDVGGICEWAATLAMRDSIKQGMERKITMDDFLTVINKGYVKPSVIPWLIEAQRKISRNRDIALAFPELVEFITKFEENRYIVDGS